MGKCEDEMIAKIEDDIKRKRDKGRMGAETIGKILKRRPHRPGAIRKENGDLGCKSLFKSLRTDR
jgi:hypothetical protein